MCCQGSMCCQMAQHADTFVEFAEKPLQAAVMQALDWLSAWMHCCLRLCVSTSCTCNATIHEGGNVSQETSARTGSWPDPVRPVPGTDARHAGRVTALYGR